MELKLIMQNEINKEVKDSLPDGFTHMWNVRK